MSRLNEYKKVTFEDKFLRKFSCCTENHREVWAYYKRNNRRSYRRFLKKELKQELAII